MVKKIIFSVISLIFIFAIAIAGIFAYNRYRVLNGQDTGNCLLLDRSYEIGRFQKNGKHYYIYSVITGWHDKSYAYQLHEKEVKTNECGAILNKPLLTADIPAKRTAKKLIVKKDELEIVYLTTEESSLIKKSDQSKTMPMGNVEIEVLTVPN